MTSLPVALDGETLRRCCDPASFDFKTTDDLEPLDDSVGQQRAVDAVKFGVGMRHEGYNLFAFGPPGSGKYSLVRRYVEKKAVDDPAPSDWCYVNNFAEPHKPRILRMPAGRGAALRDDMKRLVEDLQATISATFESEDYLARKQAIEEEFKERHEKAFNDLQEQANKKDTALIRTPMGFAFAPMDRGEVVSPEIFRNWPRDHQEKIKKTITKLEEELQKLLKLVPQWQREQRDKIRELNNEVTEFAVGHLIDALAVRYADLPDLVRYFGQVQEDVVRSADDFVMTEPETPEQAQAMALRQSLSGPPSFRRYQVNVIVDHADHVEAPVVYEDHPTHPNLVGRIEHMAQFGALSTDFNLIKAGALHAANGGYLILDARRLLMQPYAWEELKRALESREIRIQGAADFLGIASTVSLDPEAVPLDVKVVLLGDRTLYYMLSQLDPDFPELFKVAVDFEDRMDRSDENDLLFARLIATVARREALRPFDAASVGRVIDHAARLAADSEKLSLHIRPIVDLLREADFWAEQAGVKVVSADQVRQAIDAQRHRSDRIRERSQEEIERGTILIDTEGAVVGQVNGLAVFQLGEFSFGRPSRITARVRLGKGEVVDIEREVALGGALHSKGVMILSGFLGERFGRDRPLAISASIVFEQSYSGVDGDSASSTELYALLSAISGTPILQRYAVTGSVNQRGEVQAIGGVNEKIEGYFGVCAARGLTGDQGVLIPATNVKHLMLRDDVVDAVAAGKFFIYPIETIDQGIEVLTGVPAGEIDDEGNFPAATINGAVQAELKAFAEKARAFGMGGGGMGGSDRGGGDREGGPK
jgi:lon-related putative ATP-dependent protease